METVSEESNDSHYITLHHITYYVNKVCYRHISTMTSSNNSSSFLLCGFKGSDDEDEGEGGFTGGSNIFICENGSLPKRSPEESKVVKKTFGDQMHNPQRNDKRKLLIKLLDPNEIRSAKVDVDYLRQMPGQSLCDGMACAIETYQRQQMQLRAVKVPYLLL